MGSSAVAVSSSVCIFPACHSFLPLEPGTGSSHPGNVRRQGPPRRSSELGHPIRRKSVSSFTMAGPEANKHHLLRMSVTLLPPSPPCSPPAEPLTASPPPAPSSASPLKTCTERPKVKARRPPCGASVAASAALVMLSSECAYVHVCARDRRRRGANRSRGSLELHTHESRNRRREILCFCCDRRGGRTRRVDVQQ